MTTTGGAKFDPAARPVYFLAVNANDDQRTAARCHRYVLLAVNELLADDWRARMDMWVEDGHDVLLDSGIYWMTNQHARAHGISMDVALGMPPNEIDGFDRLWDRYVDIVRTYEPHLWGYIELDQGGRDQKRATRGRLHDIGLQPMPVYHPLLDGWEYFDELAEGYDRMCFGNVVQADISTRKRFMHTCWERHRAYPDLWVHLLGLTPNEWAHALPLDSADSSTWKSGIRWGTCISDAMLRSFSLMDDDWNYAHGDKSGEAGHVKAATMQATAAACDQRGWQHWRARTDEMFGLTQYPPFDAHEPVLVPGA